MMFAFFRLSSDVFLKNRLFLIYSQNLVQKFSNFNQKKKYLAKIAFYTVMRQNQNSRRPD